MPQEQSELQKLFKTNDRPFAVEAEVAPAEEVIPEDIKNRHIRRLEQKLQAEREASIAREARLQAISEAQKFRQDTHTDEYDEMITRIFGTDKPENAAATELLQKIFKGYSERSKKEAVEEIRNELRQQNEEEDKERRTVQDYIEQIEDQYGVDFTSTDSARERQKAFKELWFRLSPKDADGEVKEYADPFEVYDIFQQSQGNRAQDLSARGMVRSQPVQTSVQDDATVKYLKEQGIIDPF